MMIQIQAAGKPKRRRWPVESLVRQGVMLFFFVFLLHVAWEHQLKGGGPRGTPSVEAYCPFGGIENLYQFATTGGFIRHIEPSAMIVAAAVLLLTLLFSRGFCGWICPFGSVQEWLGWLGRRLFGKRFNPTGVWERRLRHLKYVILAVVIGFTWYLGVLVFRPYDPFLAFFHLGAGFDEMPYAYATLGVVLLGSLLIERFFCKYFCPLGAVIGLLGRVGLTKVERSDDGCKGCNLCQKKCFAHIDVMHQQSVTDLECNHCLECVTHCPKPNVLRLRGLRWSFPQPVYGAMLVGGLLALVGISQATEYWRTKPAEVSFRSAGGHADPDQIRGWMTLAEISQGYSIPLERLYAAAGLPARVAADTRLNQVAKRYQLKFEPDALREVVAGLLETPAAPKAAPVKAAEPVAAAQPVKPAAAQPKPVAPPAPAPPPQPEQHSGSDEEVKGMMTLNEIALKTGVDKDWLLRRLEITAEIDPRQPVRTWMHTQGKSIQDVREAVAAWRAGAR